MRLLVLNSYDFPSNLLADSSYTLTRRIIGALPEGYSAIWPLPDLAATGMQHYTAKGKVLVPANCFPMALPTYAGRAVSEMMISNQAFETFNPINGSRVDYDIIFTNNQLAAAKIIDWCQPTKGQPGRPPVAIFDYSTPFVGPECELAYLRTNLERVLMHYVGIANADALMSPTEFMMKKTAAQAREIFSHSILRSIHPKHHLVPMIFSAKSVLKATKISKKRPRVTVYWGGRLTATKRVQLALEVADYLFSFGDDIDMVVTLPGEHVDLNKLVVGAQKKYPSQIEIHKGLSQEAAWQQMASCHVSVFPQSLRFGPASPMEQIAAGLIVLINKKDYANVLPEDYPWFFSSLDELQVLIRRVTRNYKEEVKKQPKWKKFVIENRSIEANMDKFAGILENIYAPTAQHFKEIQNSLFAGRIDDVNHKEPWSRFIKRIVKEHNLFGQLKNSIIPNRLNPSFWGVYQTIKNRLSLDDTVADPIIYRKRR